MESIVLPIGLFALKLVASPMANKLNSLSEMNNETEINLIQGKLSKIKNMLSIIEGRFDNKRNDNLKRWINMARNVAYEFADFQDDCELVRMKHEKQLLSVPRHVSKLRQSSKIQSIKKKLDDTLHFAETLNLKELKENVSQGRETTAFPFNDERMIGREDVKDDVIKMLKSESVEDKSNYIVIPIEGMGGIGKTTLAQYIYKSVDIKEHFELKIWICVSDNFDEVILTKKIIDSIKSNHSSSNDNWNVLQTKLIELLSGKRFLLVLDDVWNHEAWKWEKFKNVFGYGQKGSKILVTTRLPMVSKMIRPKNMDHIVLEDLSIDNIRDVFKMFAFQRCDDIDSRLEEIGEDICKKLKGSPLAAKTIGKLLNHDLTCRIWNHDHDLLEHWEAVSNSELWNLDQNDPTYIMPALLLSYQHLPEDLKPCFAFFSLFPKDHILDGEELIAMWGAHGWIKDEDNKTMEDVGKEYLNELLSRSIIQSYKKLDKKYPGVYEIQTEKYVMHDLIHDLALLVSKDEYLFVKSESDLHKISSNIIHLSIYCNCDIGRVQKEDLCNLRTIIVGEFLDSGIDDNIFAKAKKLRVFQAPNLHIHDSDIIKNAKYLRFLHISRISELPSSFYTLYFLQVLIMSQMPKMSKETNKLVNLRRIKASYGDGHHISKGVSKMRMLRELSFDISNEIGETIKELKNLKTLEKLSLFHLGRVVSNEDVMECNLMGKRHLHELKLSWEVPYGNKIRFWNNYNGGSSINNVSEYDVFQGLQPPENLRDLQIHTYGGIRSPNWMKNLSLLNLQRIVISGCRCWNMEDVSFGHLPNLEYLEIMTMSGVQQLGPKFFGDGDVKGFPSLEILKFSKLENLEEWRMCSDNHPNTQIFPRLQQFLINFCPKLKIIPFQIPSTMRVIELESCINLKFLPSWLQHVTCLEELVIKENAAVESFSCYPNLRSLHNLQLSDLTESVSLHLNHLSNLGTLVIDNCPKLSVSSTVVSSQLKKFIINSISLWQLKEWLMVLSSNTTTTTSSELKYLEIYDCPELMYFDADMDETLHKLTNLSCLSISSCPNLVSLPENGLPSSLQFLGIYYCPKLSVGSTVVLPSQLTYFSIFKAFLWQLKEWLMVLSRKTSSTSSELQYLKIDDCPELMYFDADMDEAINKLTNLSILNIFNCPNLVSLPENGLPSSLQTLYIYNCGMSKERFMEGGADCHKIEHIPEIYIGC